MRFSAYFASLTATLLADTVFTLGINCRGSGLCPLASWDNQSPLPIMQILRDVIYQSKVPDSTPYNSGDHVLCVSNTLTVNLSVPIIDPTGLTSGLSLGSWHLGAKIKDGGICIFPQYLRSGPITLGTIRKLIDKLLEHGCETCGSVPIHFVDKGSNDPSDGILTFNYVRHPYCTENCLTDGLVGNVNVTKAVETSKMVKRLPVRIPAGRTASAIEGESFKEARSVQERRTEAAATADDESEASKKGKAQFESRNRNDAAEREGTLKRNALPLPLRKTATENHADAERKTKEKRATRANAERKRAAAAEVQEKREKRELKSASARFAAKAPLRRNEGPLGIKGWIGWLRRG